MNQKIEWYREVLEIEPGSRVFFPLAKLLAADHDTEGAVKALQSGLLRHPDHIEARLLLVELLSTQGNTGGLKTELAALADLFGKYPSFWKIWSTELAQNPAMQDAALAISFFAAALSGQPVTWASVIAHGLQSLLQGQSDAPLVAPAPSATPPLPEKEAPATALTSTVGPLVAGEDAYDETDTSAQDDEPEEPFSLRTRSMADVLAEQGDTAGALEIYRELITTASPEEAPGLQARIESLSAQAAPASASSKADLGDGEHVDGGRLVSLLENLAGRFEARAR